MIAMLLKSMLGTLNCNVVGIASRLQDALKKAESLAFDVALVDVNLAGTLSYPVAHAIQKRGIPFIFTTSYGQAALPVELRLMPLLSKPFDLARLSAALVAVRQGASADAVPPLTVEQEQRTAK